MSKIELFWSLDGIEFQKRGPVFFLRILKKVLGSRTNFVFKCINTLIRAVNSCLSSSNQHLNEKFVRYDSFFWNYIPSRHQHHSIFEIMSKLNVHNITYKTKSCPSRQMPLTFYFKTVTRKNLIFRVKNYYWLSTNLELPDFHLN